MNMHERFTPAATPNNAPASSLRARLAALLRHWSECWAAMAAYEDLARLSDAELRRRGLTRDVLAREVADGSIRGRRT